jgi:hypothetical protein
MDNLINPGPGHVAVTSLTNEPGESAVSWAAIIAGAFVAASASLLMLALGAGLGLTSVSPWRDIGASATTFTVMTAIWFIVVQWVASGLGGYLTGRLRTRWVGVHTHEVFFRDTAHGFVAWSVATLMVAVVIASVASLMISGGIHAAATVGSSAAQGVANAAQNGSVVAPYDVDLLFRPAQPDASTTPADVRAESSRILAKGLTSGDVPTADRSYVAALVAARTGISQAEADKRVDDAFAQVKAADAKARQVADAARKAAAKASIFTALAMLIGAFIACVAAVLGGHRRDEHR